MRKLLSRLLAFTLLLCTGELYAAAPVTRYTIASLFSGQPSVTGDTIPQAGALAASAWTAHVAGAVCQGGATPIYGTQYSYFSFSGTTATFTSRCGTNAATTFTRSVSVVSVCQNGTQPNTQLPLAQQCPDLCTAGQTIQSGWFNLNEAQAPAMSGCNGGCVYVFDGMSPSGGTTLQNGQRINWARGVYRATGATCSGETSQQPTVPQAVAERPADTCAGGNQVARMNGRSVCVAAPTAGASAPTQPTAETTPRDTTTTTRAPTVTAPDGTRTDVTTSTRTLVDGRQVTTTTTTVTAPDGAVTTTSQTTGSGLGASGADTGSTDDEGPQDPCEANSSAAGCGGTPGPIGELYEDNRDDTLTDVISGHRDALIASPMGTAVTNFFTFNVSGSCPTWVLNIDYFSRSYDFDFLCTESVQNIVDIMRICILITGAFFAFRVAIDN